MYFAFVGGNVLYMSFGSSWSVGLSSTVLIALSGCSIHGLGIEVYYNCSAVFSSTSSVFASYI